MHYEGKADTFSRLDLRYNRHYTWHDPYIFMILTDIGDLGLKFMIPFTDFENIG